MLERWFILAGRYVTAIEATAIATERIASAQERSFATLERNGAANLRAAEAQATMAEAHSNPKPGEVHVVLPELGEIALSLRDIVVRLTRDRGDG